MSRLKGRLAILLRPHIFLDEMTKSPRPNPRDTEKVILAAHQTNGKSMNTKDVLALEGIGIIAAEHILIAQAVRKDGQQGIPRLGIGHLADTSKQHAEAKQLPLVKHFSVIAIAPAVQPIRLIA